MKKKILLVSLASTLAIGTSVAAVLFSRSVTTNDVIGSTDLTLTIEAGEITTSTTYTSEIATFEHATDATKSSATKNTVEFEYWAVSYGTQSETKYNYFQGGIGYIKNTKGHELRSLSSVTYQGYGNFQVGWGWLVDDAIKYERYETISAGTPFDFEGDKPNYVILTSLSYSPASVTQLVFSYDSKCEASEDPYYTHSDGLKYYLYDDHAKVLGFSGSSVPDVVIPDTVKGLPVTIIGDSAFKNDSTVETVTLGANVVELEEHSLRCSNLETVSGISQLKRIGYNALSGSQLSGTITFGPNLESIAGSAFYGCNSITTVVFNDDCTASVNNGAFNHSTGIVSCHIGAKMTGSIPTFYGASSLTTFTVGAGNTKYIAFDGVLYYISGADIQGLVFPMGKTSYVAPNDSRVNRLNYEFAEYSLVETVDLGDYIQVLDGSAFISCANLTTVTGNAVTFVGYEAFRDCTSLVSMTLPDTLERIDGIAFKGCTSLTSITYTGTVAQWEAFAKSSDWNEGSSLTQIVCSDDTIIL